MPVMPKISTKFDPSASAVVFQGDCLKLFSQIPDESTQLVVTSPPYNVGKAYEKSRSLSDYLADQAKVIAECVRVLHSKGSICWQVGNYIERGKSGSIVPLDLAMHPLFVSHGLKLRNRIVWHFEHGLHCSKRLSGRYEVILWYTKSDDYYFDLDSIRVPQKYPGKKYFKGPKAGQLSCNPKGKNPGDVWIIPNVKHNHVEKTGHPCQFPVELVERLVLSLSAPGDLVLDPFAGVGTTMAAAVRNGRRGVGSEIDSTYVRTARERVLAAANGALKVRERNTPVFEPPVPVKKVPIRLSVPDVLQIDPPGEPEKRPGQLKLLQRRATYGVEK